MNPRAELKRPFCGYFCLSLFRLKQVSGIEDEPEFAEVGEGAEGAEGGADSSDKGKPKGELLFECSLRFDFFGENVTLYEEK